MIRVNLVEDNQEYDQKIIYKFDVDDDDALFNEWNHVNTIDDISNEVNVWHCGIVTKILKTNILSLSVSLVENDDEQNNNPLQR